MNLAAFQCFCALVESGGFHAAARKLHRTQPAVTQQVRSLERSLKEPLWDRKAAVCTLAGEALYVRAREILARVDNIPRELAELKEQPPVELRIGTSDTNALYVLPKSVREFRRTWPETRLRIVSRSSAGVAEAVDAGELDFGIVTLPQHNERLHVEPLFEQRLVLAVPKDHRLAKRRRVRPENLDGEPLILLEEDTQIGRLLREAFQTAGISPQVVMDSGSFEVIKRYVAEGLGCSIIPESAMLKGTQSGVVSIPISGFPPVRFGAVWRKDEFLSGAAESILKSLKEFTIAS